MSREQASRVGGGRPRDRRHVSTTSCSRPTCACRRRSCAASTRSSRSELGFWPLAIRFNERYAFHTERMAHGHGNPFLDLDHATRCRAGRWVERGIQRWYFSPRRYVPRALLAARCASAATPSCSASLQTPAVVPLVAGARRLGKPVVGYVASWDHPVGKGVISSVSRRLHRPERRHAGRSRPLPRRRSGARRRHRLAAERLLLSRTARARNSTRLLGRLGLDPALPVVLVMGNTPTNTPYEPAFFERLLGWWESSRRERPLLAALPAPPERPSVAGAVRCGRSGGRALRSSRFPRRVSNRSRPCSPTAHASSRTRARSCSTPSSTTGLPSASFTTRALRRASHGPRSTCSARTIAS